MKFLDLKGLNALKNWITTNFVLKSEVSALPSVTSADNGKILIVTNGEWSVENPTNIYSGTSEPSSTLGNDGDIYLQT